MQSLINAFIENIAIARPVIDKGHTQREFVLTYFQSLLAQSKILIRSVVMGQTNVTQKQLDQSTTQLSIISEVGWGKPPVLFSLAFRFDEKDNADVYIANPTEEFDFKERPFATLESTETALPQEKAAEFFKIAAKMAQPHIRAELRATGAGLLHPAQG